MYHSVEMKIIISIICALAVQHGQCEVDIQPRVAGTPVGQNDDLYELAVLTEDGRVCTATLIDSLWALTSASCASRFRSSPIRVSHDKTPKEFKDAEYITDIFLHPGYKESNLMNDIALIALQSPAPITSRIRIIPSVTERFTSGTVYGYGTSTGYALSKAPTSILDTVRCQKYATMFTNRLCTFRSLACEGDQGGPLVSDNKLIGVVSINEFQTLGCNPANPIEPVVTYIRVAPYKPWIKAVTKLNYL